MVEKIIAVICDNISGRCVLATEKNFADKHFMVRQEVGKNKLPCKNLQGETVTREYGWTDAQTLVIENLSKENLEKTLKDGYQIPKEVLELKE